LGIMIVIQCCVTTSQQEVTVMNTISISSVRCVKGSRVFSGFSLVELIIVISIVAILSAVLISVLNPQKYQGSTRDSKRKTDLAVIQGALEIYFETNKEYPISGGIINSSQSAWSSLVGSEYLSKIPTDPKNAGGYYYYYLGTANNYELNTVLEEDVDSSLNDGGNNSARYEVGSDLTLIN